MGEGQETTGVAPLARSLEEALPGSLVFVDRRGDVIPPRRARLQAALASGTRAGLGTVMVIVCASLFGWVGAVVGSAYLTFGLWNLVEGRRAARAWRLLASDPAAAEAILLPLARGRWRPEWIRAGAHAALGHVAAMRGDAESALSHYRAAVASHARTGGAKRVHGLIARHGEVFALVNLGRVGEARATLNALGPLPTGDYLRFQRWACELYVCFGEGRHDIDPDDLHARSLAALRLSSGGTLVALCAWAHAAIGDHDQAAHLLAEAGERSDAELLTRTCPKLRAWMTAYGGG